MTTPTPIPDPARLIHRPALSPRAPYDVHDTTFDEIEFTDTAVWRRLRRLDRVCALHEPLAGLHLTEHEEHIIDYLSGLETHVIAVLVALLWRARLDTGGAR